jgi:pimeloyl-ACP methyl ester carboxylesterase
MSRRGGSVGLATCCLLVAACASTAVSSPSSSAVSPTAATASSTSAPPAPTTGAVSAAANGDGVVWLCRPDSVGDPCMTNESSTTVSPTKDLTVVTAPAATTGKPVDCFYVYPTVSTQTTANADLTIEASEIKVAEAQASRFSSVCDVWAPMYRQRPLNARETSAADDAVAGQVAYDSVAGAWHDYLDHFNDGKPIVLLGHSQGAGILINLLQREVDNDQALRARIVSALILGGNVEVPAHDDVGSTFQHIPACRAPTQTGCVIAYSSFPAQPPPDAVFGIADQGIDESEGQTAKDDTEVLCTNPASLANPDATTALDPYFWIADRPSRLVLTTDWVAFPALYTAECHHAANATWLQINDIGSATDTRTRLALTNGAQWGYHVYDFNVALGDLVTDVTTEIAAYLAAHPH